MTTDLTPPNNDETNLEEVKDSPHTTPLTPPASPLKQMTMKESLAKIKSVKRRREIERKHRRAKSLGYPNQNRVRLPLSAIVWTKSDDQPIRTESVESMNQLNKYLEGVNNNVEQTAISVRRSIAMASEILERAAKEIEKQKELIIEERRKSWNLERVYKDYQEEQEEERTNFEHLKFFYDQIQEQIKTMKIKNNDLEKRIAAAQELYRSMQEDNVEKRKQLAKVTMQLQEISKKRKKLCTVM